MCGLLKPDELLASRRLERIEIFSATSPVTTVILPAFEKIDRRLESRCRLEKINRKELAPEVFERKFRASNHFPARARPNARRQNFLPVPSLRS